MSEPRIIKRYANRKLYDTQHSRYVTLEQIADMVREGEDVRIVDNTTKEDLTSVTLAQIILEEEKRKKSFLPLAAMRHIIQTGGESIQELASQAGAKVRSVLRIREGEGEDGQPLAEGEVVEEGTQQDGVAAPLRELLESPQKALDELQKKVDDRIQKVVESISPFASLQRELATLTARVADLEKRLDSK
jgi:polyhydroxyalkanoate synthesis repressor PhaR